MTNEDFYSLRIQISNLLEEFGLRDVQVHGTLEIPRPAESVIGGWPTPVYPRPDLLVLNLEVSAKLAPGEFHIPTPRDQIHDQSSEGRNEHDS